MSARRRFASIGALLGAVALLTVSARADAPAGHYDSFDKTAQTIRDPKAYLVWQRYDVLFHSGTVAEAEGHCALRGPGWRLPTVKELLTLVDEDPHAESDLGGGASFRAIDRNAFPATPVDAPFLAASTSATTWTVDFSDGTARSGVNAPYYVRCVLAQ